MPLLPHLLLHRTHFGIDKVQIKMLNELHRQVLRCSVVWTRVLRRLMCDDGANHNTRVVSQQSVIQRSQEDCETLMSISCKILTNGFCHELPASFVGMKIFGVSSIAANAVGMGTGIGHAIDTTCVIPITCADQPQHTTADTNPGHAAPPGHVAAGKAIASLNPVEPDGAFPCSQLKSITPSRTSNCCA